MSDKLTHAEEDTLLREIRERFQAASVYWRDIRDEGRKDMLCVAGKPWEALDPEGLKQRKGANRPYLALDELGQYFNQVINDTRANPLAIKYSPVGNGATDDTAEFYTDKTREIEYRSTAQIPYTTAMQNAVQRSYGFCRLQTKYESDTSMNQELWIEEIANPDQVLPDPSSIRPDSSDMTFCFVFTHLARAEFTRQYPKAKIQDFTTDVVLDAADWFVNDQVQIAEYWKVKTTPRALLVVAPVQPAPSAGQTLPLRTPQAPQPIPVFRDELTDAEYETLKDRVLATREVEQRSVCQYLTNGVEILKTTEWKGKYIPIASCYGMVIYVDDGGGAKRTILSMTRLARDPYMLYCYYRTCEAELVGMTPKFPYFVYEGQLAPDQLVELQKSLHEPVAVIRVRPTVPGLPATQVLSFPQRQPYEPPIQGIEMGAEAARRAIQAAMGSSPLPTQAQRHNEKSGIALKQIESAQQMGSFHFVDHYKYMVRHMGVMIEDLMDKIYDTAREVGIRKPNDTSATVRINDPAAQGEDGTQKELSTKGDHLVTVSTGPSFESQRQESSAFVDNVLGNPQFLQMLGPQKAPKMIALGIKLKALGPVGDEMVTLIDPPTPKDGKTNPQQIQQQMQELTQQYQQVTQVAQQMKQALDTDQVKQRATLEKAKIDASSALGLQRMKDATAIRVAQINASVKGIVSANEAEDEALALAQEQAHAAAQADLDRAHELGMAAVDHAHAMAQGDQAHAQSLEAGDQATASQLAVQAAQPQPEPTGAGA